MLHKSIIVFVSAVMASYGAHFTSARSGLWSDPATWAGQGVPGIEDTVRILHEVASLLDVNVGRSPSISRDTVPAITIRGGTLVVGANTRLVVRGDIRLESLSMSARATLLMYPGSSLALDSSAAAAPSAPLYRVYAPAPLGNYPRVYLYGTRDKPIRVQSVGSTHLFTEPAGNSLDVRIEHAVIEDCGTLTDGCIKHRIASGDGTDGLILQHVTMRRTSGVKQSYHAATSPANGGDVFVLHDVKTFDTISDPARSGYVYSQTKGSVYTTASQPLTTGRREITECYFDMGFPAASILAGFSIRNSVFDRYPPAVNASNGVIDGSKTWALAENNVYRALNMTARGVHGSIKDLYFYGDTRSNGRGNPHGLIVGIKGDTTIDGMTFEYGDSAVDPNGLVQQPYPLTGGPWNYTYTWRHNLMLPSSYDSIPTKTSSILVNNGLSQPSVRLVLENNTFMVSGNVAQTNYFNETGIAPAGSIRVFRSNLAWDVRPGRSYMITVNTFRSTSPANALDPAGTDYNACWNCMVTSPARWAGSTSNGTVYDVPTTDVIPGPHDVVNADPYFIDPTRNIKRWVERRTGLPPFAGTIDQAMQYLASGPGSIKDRIADLQRFVRIGYMPRSAAYIGTAHDGGTIGAVAADLSISNED